MGLNNELLRRGAQLVQQSSDKQTEFELDMSSIAFPIFFVTAIIYYVAMFKIRYSLAGVIGALTIIESPQTDVFVEVNTLDDDGMDKKATDNLLEPEVLLVKTKPVTSKIRTAVRHLKAKAGRRSRFRGFSLFVVYEILKNVIALHLSLLFRSMIGRSIAVIAAEVLLCQLEMAWYQIVISMPSSKRWYQRLQSRKSWVKIAPAAFVKAIAGQLTVGLPAALTCHIGPMKKVMHDTSYQFSQSELRQAAIVLTSAALIGIVYLFLVYIPAYVIMVRVSASMLSEEDETIVNFDRSFAGKVIPAIVGGSGKVSMIDAWKSFTWEARRRFLGLMVKTGAIMTAVTILFGMIGAAEFFVLAGPQTKGFVAAVLKQHGSQ